MGSTLACRCSGCGHDQGGDEAVTVEEGEDSELAKEMRQSFKRSAAQLDLFVEDMPTLLRGLDAAGAALAAAAVPSGRSEGGRAGGLDSEEEEELEDMRALDRVTIRPRDGVRAGSKDDGLGALSTWTLNPVKPTFSNGACIRPEDSEKFPAFINAMIEHLWPYISDFATKILGDVLEPSIKSALGSYGGSFGFDLADCHLGSAPAIFRDVRINRAEQVTEGGVLDNIVLRGVVEWAGDINIASHVGALSVGVRGVKLSGTLCIECVGLMARPPFVQGIRAFFVNPPSLDLDFQGRLTSVLEFSSIKRQVMEVMSRQVASKLVVPNRMGVQLDPQADYFRVLKPRPKGILVLTVVRAVGLLAMDRVTRSSDPYVVVRCGAERHRSPTVRQSLTPKFDFQVRLPVVAWRHQRVTIELWDADYAKTDDFLGRLDLSFEELLAAVEGRGEAWLELEGEAEESGSRGRLLLAAAWRPLLLAPPGPERRRPAAYVPGAAADAGWVFAGVYGAARLPGEAPGTKFWVVASCTGLLAPTASHGKAEVPDAAPRSTPRLERQAPVERDCSEAAVETARMDRKLAILRKHGVPPEDIAKVLEIDAGSIARQAPTQELCATERHTLRWNHAFEFLVASVRQAEVRFDVRCQRPGAKEESLGTCAFDVQELLEIPSCTLVQALPVNASVTLKVRMQFRHLGTPEVSPAAGPVASLQAAARAALPGLPSLLARRS